MGFDQIGAVVEQRAEWNKMQRAMRNDLESVELRYAADPHKVNRAFSPFWRGSPSSELVPMHILQKYMGHKEISTTAMYYLAANDVHAERIRKAFSANKQPTPADSADAATVEDDEKPGSEYDEVA